MKVIAFLRPFLYSLMMVGGDYRVDSAAAKRLSRKAISYGVCGVCVKACRGPALGRG